MYFLVVSNLFRGVSIQHFSGFKYSIIYWVKSTILSARAKFRMLTVLAILNSVQGTPQTVCVKITRFVNPVFPFEYFFLYVGLPFLDDIEGSRLLTLCTVYGPY